MRYQLVLQFPASSIADYDKMIAIEDELIEKLGVSAKIDGHDFGSEQMNIFIHTDKPEEHFEGARTIIAERKLLEDLTAAFREITGDDYTVIWPIGFKKQFCIT